MNINLIYSIIGFHGGLLCCVADILLDLKGKDNKVVGNINTNWKKMSLWRFHWSINIAAITIPMINLGYISLGNQVADASPILGFIFKTLGYLSNVGSFFVHVTLCYTPCMYKGIDNKKAAEQAINALFKAAQVPFLVFFLIGIFGISGSVTYALIKNYIQLSNFFILLTPFITFIFSVTLRKIKYNWFIDLLRIIMPSFGMGCVGLIGALNILLN